MRTRVVVLALLTLFFSVLIVQPSFAACIVQADGWSAQTEYCWVALTDSAHAVLLNWSRGGCSRTLNIAPPDTNGIVMISIGPINNWAVNLFYSNGSVYQTTLYDYCLDPSWYLVHQFPTTCSPQSTAIGENPQPQFQRDFRSAPNPTTRASEVAFVLPARTRIKAAIYDTQGRCVRRLTEVVLNAGQQKLRWDGTSDNGTLCPPGQYIWKVDAGDSMITTKTVMLR